jgi:hypothetical protein
MTISKELFLSILSMDSYNRGYGEGVGGLGDLGSKIGTATLSQQSDTAEGPAGVNAGFYAISYTIGSGVDGLASGTTVISYRGTNADNVSSFVTDAWNGYGTAPGTPPTARPSSRHSSTGR